MCIQKEASAFPSSVVVSIKKIKQRDRNTWTSIGSGSGHKCPRSLSDLGWKTVEGHLILTPSR